MISYCPTRVVVTDSQILHTLYGCRTVIVDLCSGKDVAIKNNNTLRQAQMIYKSEMKQKINRKHRVTD